MLKAELPLTLHRRSSIRAIERSAIETLAIEEIELMRRAAAAAFAVLRKQWPQAQRIAVVCGSGNNAGDGLLLALLLQQQGFQVTVFRVTAVHGLRGAAAVAAAMVQAAECVVQALPPTLSDYDVIVDALLGIGLSRPLEGAFAAAVTTINAAAAEVLALDLPSGLNADSGAISGCCVRAAATVTFIALKPGLLTGKARDVCGHLFVDDLALPQSLCDQRIDAMRDHAALFIPPLPPRANCSHKGDHGRVVIVGANHGYAGAARIAAESAMRCGAGLVSVVVRSGNEAAVLAGRAELMVHGVADPPSLQPPPVLRAAHIDVLLVGNGLARDRWAQQLLALSWSLAVPLVVDADALNLLADGVINIASRAALPGCVYTPHPGEAARLLYTTVAAVEHDRFAALAALIERYAGVWVLKGAGTLVGCAGALTHVVDGGNPSMATAGMGDALAGIIAAFIAQGMVPFDAARAAVALHAEAADRAARDGQRGMLASDLLVHLRQLVN